MKGRRHHRSERRLRSTVGMHVTHAIAAHAYMTHTETVRRILQICFSAFLLFVFSPALLPSAGLPSCTVPPRHSSSFIRSYENFRTTASFYLTAQLFFLPFLCLLVVTFNGSSRCKVRALETHERHDFLANDKRNDSVARFSRNIR